MNGNAEKWGRRFFRTGAMVLLLAGLVHSLSFFVKQTPANDTEAQLLGLMANYKFNLMGSVRSMDELMRGFSVAFMLAALVTGTLGLALSGEQVALLKKVALIYAIWLAAMAAVSLRYFFVIPISFLATALLLFVLAWLKLPAEETA
jgi:hypothetical protein